MLLEEQRKAQVAEVLQETDAFFFFFGWPFKRPAFGVLKTSGASGKMEPIGRDQIFSC